ncbi:MAG TPA: AI-2E family transporter [Flavisolibacter sp.]|nr:AI-2E family transporter [Flavisolibacter sp.]
MEKDSYTNNLKIFTKKVWITGGILAFLVIILLLLKATFSVLLLILAGTLIAVFFRGLSSFIQRKTKWQKNTSLIISITIALLFLILIFWLMGSKLATQITQFNESFPTTIENAKQQLNKTSIGKQLVEKLSSEKTHNKLTSVAQTFFKTSFGVLGDIYVVLFIGIFFTVSPSVYKKGLIQLVPKPGKPTAENVLEKMAINLEKWLKGKLFAMLVVFILTATGLLIIGVPMWLVLALIAGILNFIPNFGPLIALIPAVLVALLQGPSTAAWVAGLYICVQIAESNFITPMVQQKLINIPPALIIIAQLLIAPLSGGWGLVVATPLMILIIVLVQELYIRKQDA